MSVKHAYALLDGILPDNVVMNKQYTKDKRELLESVTFLLLPGEQDVEDEVKMLADLRSLNYREGKLNNEYKVFMDGVKAVIEIAGSGAQSRRHTLGNDLQKTTNVVYTSSINSISQLMKRTIKYLVEDKQLEKGKGFLVPCDEFVRRQFSPSYENRKASMPFTGELEAKRTLIKKNTRQNNDHAHYAAALWVCPLHLQRVCKGKQEE